MRECVKPKRVRKMNKPELLAPAGSEKCVYAAVQSGADSVYLGLKDFGARSYADNFDEKAFRDAVDYCHLRRVKVYVTLNTLIADVEMPRAVECAHLVANAGADGIIVQDIGLLELVKKNFPELPLHISTQATVMNSDAMKLAKELGAVRAVVARELSREEIKSIAENSHIETEIFVHGAQCYSYSGQCLMSSIYGGRSGNRGKCAGPCRLPYTLADKKGKAIDSGYLLSPVDMCLGMDIDKVMSLGVHCLKIEGRMKGPEYVSATCMAYRNALSSGKSISQNGLTVLENTFSRGGFSSGFFEGGVSRIKKDKSNDDAYANQDEKLLEEFKNTARRECNLKRLPVTLEFYAKTGEKAKLVLSLAEGRFETESNNEAEAAKGAPLTRERIAENLNKLGDFPFYAEKTLVYISDNLFMPMSEINAMRRRVATLLAQHITASHLRCYEKANCKKPAFSETGSRYFTVSALNKEQAEEAAGFREIEEIYLAVDAAEEGFFNNRVIPAFPAIIREKHIDRYRKKLEKLKMCGVKKVLVSDWGMAYNAVTAGLEFVAGCDLNVFNSHAAEKWHNMKADSVILSREMTVKQLENMRGARLQITAYGRPALMKTANCPLKDKKIYCGTNSDQFTLTDRKGEKIRLVCRCGDCTAYLFNSKPVYMADKLSDIPPNIRGINLSFTTEAPRECKDIITKYLDKTPPEGEFTRGHFYRGVLK